MVTVEDLKKIYIMRHLSEDMMAKIAPHVETFEYDNNAVVFDQNQEAKTFHMLVSGKVLLKSEVSPAVTISLGSIKEGYSFGWSALSEGGSYTSQAACAEPCRVHQIEGVKFREVMDSDHTLGYLIMQGVARILENRLQRRTEQFIKTLRKQMEIWDLW